MRRLRSYIRLLLLGFPGGCYLVREIDKRLLAPQKRKRIKDFHDNWREVYTAIHSSLSCSDVCYWIDFGSLIGLVRENGILMHDEDVDCCVPPNVNLHDVYRVLRKAGFSFVSAYALDDVLTEITFEYKGVYVDVFKCHIIGDRFGYYCYETEYDIRTCERIKTVAHERYHARVNAVEERSFASNPSVLVNIPVNFDEVLTLNYGNWRIPDRHTNYCGKSVPSHYRDAINGCAIVSEDRLPCFK